MFSQFITPKGSLLWNWGDKYIEKLCEILEGAQAQERNTMRKILIASALVMLFVASNAYSCSLDYEM
jgi:hypothetical protein